MKTINTAHWSRWLSRKQFLYNALGVYPLFYKSPQELECPKFTHCEFSDLVLYQQYLIIYYSKCGDLLEWCKHCSSTIHFQHIVLPVSMKTLPSSQWNFNYVIPQHRRKWGCLLETHQERETNKLPLCTEQQMCRVYQQFSQPLFLRAELFLPIVMQWHSPCFWFIKRCRYWKLLSLNFLYLTITIKIKINLIVHKMKKVIEYRLNYMDVFWVRIKSEINTSSSKNPIRMTERFSYRM